MNYFLLFSLVVFTSCSTVKERWEVSSDEISTDMAPVNIRLRGMLARKEKLNDFSVLTNTDYLKRVNGSIESSEKQYFEFLNEKDTTFEFVGRARDFVVCAKNRRAILVLCHKASSAMVDFVSGDIDLDIKAKAISFFE